jgi:hypothetical protein
MKENIIWIAINKGRVILVRAFKNGQFRVVYTDRPIYLNLIAKQTIILNGWALICYDREKMNQFHIIIFQNLTFSQNNCRNFFEKIYCTFKKHLTVS